MVLAHTLHTLEVLLLGLHFCGVVADELQAEFIYEHLKGVSATFDQPLVKLLGIVLAIWYDGTNCKNSQFPAGCKSRQFLSGQEGQYAWLGQRPSTEANRRAGDQLY